MLLINMQRFLQKGKHKIENQCLPIVSRMARKRLSVASSTIPRQYVLYKRRKKNDMEKFEGQKNIRVLNDNKFFHSCDNNKKRKNQKENFVKMRKQKKNFFLNYIDQSFSLIFNYSPNYNTPSTSSILKLIDDKLSKKFRFKFKLLQTICLIILSYINCVTANENVFSYPFKPINLTNSSDTSSSIESFKLITSSNFSSLENLNSSTIYSYPLDFLTNFLPNFKLFDYFNLKLSGNSICNSTTRIPNVVKSLNYPKISNFIELKRKTAHINTRIDSNVLQIESNSSFNNSELGRIDKWPYHFGTQATNVNLKFNYTNRFRKRVSDNNDRNWSTSASTQFVGKFSDFNSEKYSLASNSGSNLSSNKIPIQSALIFNELNKTLQNILSDSKNILSLDLKNINKSKILQNDHLLSDLNITDSNTRFVDDFLQPFTNISWWFKVPFPKSGYHNYSIVFLAFFITIVMMLVVIGNLLVCIAICTEKSLKTIQNWFIASLAVSDLLLGLIIMPFSLAYELIGTWIFSDLWCDFHHALDVLLTTASINNLCLISLDRYWSVTQAIEYLKKRTPCRAIFMIVFAWVFSAFVCLPPLIGWKKDNQEPGECQLSNDLGYVLYSSLGSFYIPSIVMIFVYAKIFIAARSRARKHVRKKQISGDSSTQEEKKKSSQTIKQALQQPSTSASSQENAACHKSLIINTSSVANQQAQQQIEENKKEDPELKDSQKSESKGLIKIGRVSLGKFSRRTQLGFNETEFEDDEDAKKYQHQQDSTKVQNVDNQTNAELINSKETTEEDQVLTESLSKSSVETKHVDIKKSNVKSLNFVSTRSLSAFTYDNLLAENEKLKLSDSSEKIELITRPTTLSSKVTFSPNDIICDLNLNVDQPATMVPQIVIHGSMQQLHTQTNVKRARFSINKMKDPDLNNNKNKTNEKRCENSAITSTLSAGQLDSVIISEEAELKEFHSKLLANNQLKKKNIEQRKYSNKLEIDSTAAQKLNKRQTMDTPHSLSESNNYSQAALTESTNLEKQIEPKEKVIFTASDQSIKHIESNSLGHFNKNEKHKSQNNHTSLTSKSIVKQTTNNAKIIQDGKPNYLGVNSLQNAVSISCSTMSINYDYDTEFYINEKSPKLAFDGDEFDFDDENDSSNTHDENVSKRSVKVNIKHLKKDNIFTRWSWCKKWLWLNDKCASNQEDEFACYEEDDEEEDEEFDELGRGSLKSGDHPVKKVVSKKILKKNKNKSYDASTISANNTSSSGTHGSATAQSVTEPKFDGKKSNSLFNRFGRTSNNKMKSGARSDFSDKQRSNGKSGGSTVAISQTGRQLKQRNKSSSQLHAHSSSTTAHSESSSAGQYRFHASEADRHKRRIAKAREKRATLILGLIMAAFILGYIPFSTMYLIQGICPDCRIQSALTITYWIGYTASAINPIIYTVFNRDFRRSFRKILFR